MTKNFKKFQIKYNLGIIKLKNMTIVYCTDYNIFKQKLAYVGLLNNIWFLTLGLKSNRPNTKITQV